MSAILALQKASGRLNRHLTFESMTTPPGKRLTVFVVDDNAKAAETLAADLNTMSTIKEVHTYSSYNEATLPILEHQPDVLFLDVEMPGMTGLDFLEAIYSKISFSFKVVFYTGYANYMLDAIRHSAFDFLLKPYKRSELAAIVERLVQNDGPNKGLKAFENDGLPRKIAMQTVSELLLVKQEETLLFNYASEQRSWRIRLTDGSVHPLKKSVTAEDILRLSSSFARVSNTCIINLTYLTAIENNTQQCRFSPPFNDIDVKASRRYFSKLKERFEML